MNEMIQQHNEPKGEIILYQPDETIRTSLTFQFSAI